MAPTLLPGDLLFADPAQAEVLEAGDLAVCAHPFRSLSVVKRVRRVSPSGRLELRGDNPDALSSQDSRGFGLVRAARGRVVLLSRRLDGERAPDLAGLAAAAPPELRRALDDQGLRLAGAPDRFGCEAHLELARTDASLWLTASVSALPWLQAPWFEAWRAP